MDSLDAVDDTIDEKPGKPLKRPGFAKILWGVVVVALVTLACLGTIVYFVVGQFKDKAQLASLAAPLFASKPVYNQIAYVGNDDNVWLVSPDGQERRSITTDSKGYRFPTWAPDGRYLAFVGPDKTDNTALYVTSTNDTAPTILFDEPHSAPFYLYWAPDSKTITFLTQEQSGLAMRQANADNPGHNRLLDEGNPFYWVWSPASDKLLMHVGGARAFSDEAHLSILENHQGAQRIDLNLAPGRFQAPVWSADGKYFFYIAENEDKRESIYRTNAETLEQTVVTHLAGFAYMVLSPDNKHIAYSQIEQNNRPPFGTAYIVDINGENHRRLTDRQVGSMYWSPDGSKLALLTVARSTEGPTAKIGGLAAPLPQQILLRWWIYHVETNELEPLISFGPTIDFLQTVPYFDQYHLSLTFWSPDSRYFLVAKENPGSHSGTIWVVDTTGQEEPRQVGEGRLAVWSWQ